MSETLDIVRRLEETVGILAGRVQELQDANAEKDVLITSMSDKLCHCGDCSANVSPEGSIDNPVDVNGSEGSYRTPPDAAEHPLGTPRTQAIILEALDEPIVLSDSVESGPLVPIEEEEETVAVEKVREDPLPIPPPYSVCGQRCV